MVVAIHVHPLMDLDPILGDVFTNIIPRIGVPFFFAISGYFYYQKLEKGEKVFWKYIKRLLMPYVFWSVIYFILDFIQWGHGSIKGYVFSCAYSFLVTGSHYHLWFFPALFISVIIVTLFWKLKIGKLLLPISIILYIIGCFGCAYQGIGAQIPGLSQWIISSHFNTIRRIFLFGFPFFVSGFVIQRMKRTGMETGRDLLCLLFILMIWIAEIVIVRIVGIAENVIQTLALYLLTIAVLRLLVNHPASGGTRFSGWCRTCAGVTYYSHPLVVLLISVIRVGLGSETVLFVMTIVITIVLGTMIYMFNCKAINRVLL